MIEDEQNSEVYTTHEDFIKFDWKHKFRALNTYDKHKV